MDLLQCSIFEYAANLLACCITSCLLCRLGFRYYNFSRSCPTFETSIHFLSGHCMSTEMQTPYKYVCVCVCVFQTMVRGILRPFFNLADAMYLRYRDDESSLCSFLFSFFLILSPFLSLIYSLARSFIYSFALFLSLTLTTYLSYYLIALRVLPLRITGIMNPAAV